MQAHGRAGNTMTPTPDSSGSLLSAQVTVRYPGKAPVLRGVSLEIARGEVVGLVGQSGSGKSTLAMAILGLLGRQRAIVEGNIFFQGADLLAMRERECERPGPPEAARTRQAETVTTLSSPP